MLSSFSMLQLKYGPRNLLLTERALVLKVWSLDQHYQLPLEILEMQIIRPHL